MEVVRGEEEKERLGAMGLDPRVSFLDPFVTEVFVAEAGGGSTGVESNARNAVVDGGVVAVRPIHLERFAVRLAGGMVTGGFFVTDPERIFRVEIQHAVVLHVDLRDAVVRGGQEEIVIEAELARTGRDDAVPIGAFAFGTETEVPFADDRGFVAGGFGDVGDRKCVRRDDEVAVGRGHAGAFAPEGIATGEKRVACRRAGGSGAVTAREPQSFSGEAVDVRRLERGSTIGGDVAVPEVIGHDDNDIRFLSGEKRRESGEENDNDGAHGTKSEGLRAGTTARGENHLAVGVDFFAPPFFAAGDFLAPR